MRLYMQKFRYKSSFILIRKGSVYLQCQKEAIPINPAPLNYKKIKNMRRVILILCCYPRRNAADICVKQRGIFNIGRVYVPKSLSGYLSFWTWISLSAWDWVCNNTWTIIILQNLMHITRWPIKSSINIHSVRSKNSYVPPTWRELSAAVTGTILYMVQN